MAAQIDRCRWDRRLARYQRRNALTDADASFGAAAEAVETGKCARHDIAGRYGSWSRAMKNEAGAVECEAIWQAEQAGDEAHYRDFVTPSVKAAILLALTPAPDVEAAVFKVALIKDESLDNCTWMPRHPMEIVREDMARLAKGGVE